jgi:hypothetical protein
LIIAGILTGLAGITRYIGISLTFAGILALVLLVEGEWKRRIGRASIFGLLGGAPLMSWFLRNYLLTGTASNREFIYHPLSYEKLKSGVYTVSVWFLPESIPLRMRVAIFVGLVLLLVCIFVRGFIRFQRLQSTRDRRESANVRIIALLIIYALIYLLFLFLSLTFVDASTRLDTRILLPIYAVTLLLALILIDSGRDELRRNRILSFVGIALLIGLWAFYAFQSNRILSVMRAEGRGFTGREWQNLETGQAVRELEPGGILYSTEALPLYFLTGRPAYWVPEKINPLQAREVADYQEKMETMRMRLRKPKSALIIFYRSFIREELPPLNEVIEGLTLFLKTGDGAIYIDAVNAP